MIAERATRAFWPFWIILLLSLAFVAFGFHEQLSPQVFSVTGLIAVLAAAGTFIWGCLRFSMPSRVEVFERLDATMPGRPIAALADTQAIGAGDKDSEAVWYAHLMHMFERAKQAKAAEPDINLASRDPFALRYLALTVFVVAMLFGSLWRVATVADAATAGVKGAPLVDGFAWEGWIEPPRYTGMPSLYLNDIKDESFDVPVGSRVTIRLYGEVDSIDITQSVSGPVGPDKGDEDLSSVQDFEITQSGEISISGKGGQTWAITAVPDAAPNIMFSGEISNSLRGEMKQPFSASDDYGVVAGRAEVFLNVAGVDRRYGLTIQPEPREALVLDLPMTIMGDRKDFEETLVEDLSKHPWANLPVRMTLTAVDAFEQEGVTEPTELVLPGRRFFDPLAKAIIEQRRDLLWNRDNLGRVHQQLRAITYKPEGVFRNNSNYLRLRVAMRRMEAALNVGGFTAEARDEMADVLWEIALKIEEGDLSDALEQLRRAQERLNEAIRNGASQEEIDELMSELADAMQDYMRQLAEQNRDSGDQTGGDSQEITGDQLRDMLDEIQRLMEEGRMAEAQALLQELMEMMENMQVTQSEGGERSPGQQSMDDLAETLRDQQQLSDDAFRDLQDQFNPGQQGQPNQPGQQGQPENGQQPGQQGQSQNSPGQQSGQGQQGQSPDRNNSNGNGQQSGQGQQGQQGQNPGQSDSPEGNGQQQSMNQGSGDGRRDGQGQGGSSDAQSLAERQRELRHELQRQERNLPGIGTPEGDAARDALDRAGRAMDEAEEALRNKDLSRAIDQQADALDALREGMRNLGEALANNDAQEPGQDDAQQGQSPSGSRQATNTQTDPLGRTPGTQGARIGTGKNLLQGDDVYRRAEELMDEIRRRSGEQGRPDLEREYLERLLERF